jgi:hypothetical protein
MSAVGGTHILPLDLGQTQTQQDPSASLTSRESIKKIFAMYTDPGFVPPPVLVLESTDPKHSKSLDLIDRIKVGRITSSKTVASSSNGFFESKVLSRTHAEIWGENGKV